MQRAIVSFVQDDAAEWIAVLDCFHRQHVRHDPPFRSAPWVADGAARAERVGTLLDCPLCDRSELPPGLEVLRTTPSWDVRTVPAALRHAHRVAAGSWGLLHVDRGEVRFRAATDPPTDTIVRAGESHPIPPQVDHEVEPDGAARFFVRFLGPGPST